MVDQRAILRIERPHPNLFKLYLVRSILAGPGILFLLPYLYFRYHTMRYRFDEEGVSMRWGILFRRETNLTYRRIQDIHVRSGLLQRWLGLADILVQTASGNAAAEMTIEGLREYDAVREYLYSRMRGAGHGTPDAGDEPALTAAEPAPAAADVVALLQDIRDELRATRAALEHAQGERRP